jgi:hypothetical protein
MHLVPKLLPLKNNHANEIGFIARMTRPQAKLDASEGAMLAANTTGPAGEQSVWRGK